ncbi:MAG: GNAT family N-acetyltransferase, partial [Umezawaea sp.]
MLHGEHVHLRLVTESDLAAMFAFHQDIANRGAFFPLGVTAQPVFERRFRETGFWEEKEGMLVIASRSDDAILGHIEFYPTVGYLDEIELSYNLYSTEHAGRGLV